MKKRTLAALLALTMALSMASCGKTESSDKKEKEEKVTTTTTAATTEKTAETEAAEDESSEEETKEEDSSSEEEKEENKEDDSSKEDKKDKKDKEDKKDDEKSDSGKGYSNDAYSISFDTEKWVDAESFKSLIVDTAANKSEILQQLDLNSLLDGIYYYKDEAESSYPSNMLFISPIYQDAMKSISITDEGMAELMFQSVESQMKSQEGISITEHKIVNRGGQDWLFIQTHAETSGLVYNCDEYVTFYNGYSVIISLNYGDADSPAKKDFEKILDKIKFK